MRYNWHELTVEYFAKRRIGEETETQALILSDHLRTESLLETAPMSIDIITVR